MTAERDLFRTLVSIQAKTKKMKWSRLYERLV